MPNYPLGALSRRMERKSKAAPGDNTRTVKGDHLGVSERAQGSLLDQTMSAIRRRQIGKKKMPMEDQPGFDPTTMGNSKYRWQGKVRSGKTGGI